MNTSLEIMKGALAAVLGFPLGRSTLASKISENNKGRITVQLQQSGAPSAELMAAVQDYANGIISKDQPCYRFSISRVEAEAIYGDTMYDKFEVPAEVTELTLVYIEGVVLHATPNKFLPSTGGVGRIQIVKQKHRSGKNELEVLFDVFPTSDDNEDTSACPTCSPPSGEIIAPLNSGAVRGGDANLPQPPENGAGKKDNGDGQVVTPWEVEADEEIDYGKIVRAFGSQLITEDLISRVERLTNQRAHRFLRRGLFFSHRDLGQVLDLYEKGEKFYLYTGRGPSSESLHLGHLIPFHFTQWLQQAFKVPLVIQLTDDEKFLFKSELTLEQTNRLAYENAKDIIACGFDPALTFIFSDLDYIQHMYPTILKIQRLVTFNQTRGIFGFSESTNIGCIAFPAVQAAPSFDAAFPVVLGGGMGKLSCLIPCAIDQDAYFRMTRDVAPKLRYPKPALIHSKFFPGLQGPKGKMSSSALETAVFVTDTPKQIKKKIGGCFSGGQDTKEKQELLGANLAVDVPYQYLGFFLEDDAEYARIGEEYGAGRILTSVVKAKLIDVLTDLVTTHQQRRAEVTEEVLQQFMAIRKLEF